MDEYKIEYLKMEQSALLLIAANDDLKDENKKLKARIKELEDAHRQIISDIDEATDGEIIPLPLSEFLDGIQYISKQSVLEGK